MNLAIIYPILAILAGAMTAYQPLVNARLVPHVGAPIWASFVSFAVGTVILFVLGLFINGKFMVLETDGLKWWMFVGGALGAFFVTVSIYIVPHLGVASMIALFIAGQLVAAALLAHFGILSAAPNPITWQKLFGMVLLAAGAVITLRN